MVKTTLDVTQKGETPVDALDLVIPIRARHARLLHAVADGMRFNYGGVVPAGEGVVWESRKAARNRILGSFVPYVWVGDEYRGLCWFAASDQGWKTDDARSVQTLERRGDTILLTVHFVTRPGVFRESARLAYGMMATPAKPLPADPAWQNMGINAGGAGYRVRVMGASFYWNGQMYANFPQNRDFETIRKFAEANKQRKVDTAYFDKLIESWSEETHDLTRDYNKAHVLSGSGAGNLDAIVPYTNLRGDLTWIPEWRTFQDEWSWRQFGPRTTDRDRRKGSTDFAIAPVRSRQDFLLFYYQKFFESGFDGIYWDNIYLQACFHPLLGPAYVRDDGLLQPCMDLFESRELVKRTAVLAHQLKKKLNVSMVHMTNANIVPVFSFAGSLLGWEWHYGMTDFQDRFKADYIRAVNLPYSTGCVPDQLGGIRGSDDPQEVAWCERTRLGVTMVHELLVWGADQKLTNLRKALSDFGYGTAAVTVHRYWDDSPPVRAPEALKWLAVSKPGKAWLVFCDYGDGGEMTAGLNLKTLGLKADAAAKDWETGESVTLKDGAVRFALKRHDFKVVVLE
jgi:hypothetical protein